MVQSCAEASPAKWHLAHTTWFFETFLLREFLAGYREFNPDFRWLFNSYYNSVSDQPEKKLRASFSRPPVETIFDYRQHVQEGIQRLAGLQSAGGSDAEGRARAAPRAAAPGTAGLRHQARFVDQPSSPGLQQRASRLQRASAEQAGMDSIPRAAYCDIGFAGDGFAFDNELPRHPEYLRPFELASRLVSCGEYLDFIEDGGYRRPELWLSAGWDTVKAEGWKAPLYWRQQDDDWQVYTHVRRTAAHGIAANAGLPRELLRSRCFCQLARQAAPHGSRVGGCGAGIADHGELAGRRNAASRSAGRGARERSGADVWGCVGVDRRVAYIGYPGFRAVPGALGEYNGKFMSNQMVLRGGSVVTPASHIRATYRNFFSPATRWQFSGIRLANI